nr:TATA element modulatory factor isoform X1 [Megalopta genalis]XP_033335752.1 TATA element modulatory factor isoform X1 [Megalopta genalis]XP_033335753.1 TATA element modulatory factor isoform X1 [Megalopta genalis]XP_033335754.1 TATA element modulatory factor isoform X1 [Megalopta genalis]
MSWFDATGFANLAKSALKEAQKTIDKALDIKEDEEEVEQKLVLERRAEDGADFFASWGLKSNEDVVPIDKNKKIKQEASNSIWGSFSGSFFESPKYREEGHDRKQITQSKSLQNTFMEDERSTGLTPSLSFSEDRTSKGWNWSERTMEKDEIRPAFDVSIPSNTDETENVVSGMDDETVELVAGRGKEELCSAGYSSNEDNIVANGNTTSSETEQRNVCRQILKTEVNEVNKISSASLETDKRSVDSVEILGSRSSTDCTTTPESDCNSIDNSASPSVVGTKLNSESVEILPDSLVTSPSSVEILGDWKSDSSPYLSPVDPLHSEISSALDKHDLATPCWEDGNIEQIPTNDRSPNYLSSSDVSLHESPMEESKTPRNDLCASMESTPSPLLSPSLSASLLVSASTYPTQSYVELGPYAHGGKLTSSSIGQNLKTYPLECMETSGYPDDPDEPSLAEDSYTSASESTVATVFETLMIKQVSMKPCMETHSSSNLDTVKEKHNLHLPIEAITTQPIRKSTDQTYTSIDGVLTSKKIETDRKSIDLLLNTTIEPAEPDPEPETEPKRELILAPVSGQEESERYSGIAEVTQPYSLKSDTMDIVDHHLMSMDSSCEGTLIESNSEDNATLIHKSEGKTTEPPLTASSYVKTMLADAMTEKVGEIVEMEGQSSDMPRENSPVSSESRSDLVKIGSDQTSGHTSGDELETTTSSDIEIISRYSPNGDSSSTQSRQSLTRSQSAKGSDLLTKTLKSRGHSRELSEISIGSDEANLEIETLLKRMQEMTEILEARESKLIDVSRMNMELHEQNSNLKKQLDNFEKYAEQSQNLNQIADEYTQRLSALERKFQQAIRERDSLRKNLEQLKMEAATRLSSQEMYTLSAEKDEIIKELREEGDKLSKQQLQHSNIIKKLRIKEKESDALIKNQKQLIDEQTSEMERLKKSLHAKEEVERTQIEAVHTLTAKTRKQEKDILALQEKLDTTLHKMDAYKTSLDATKMDLIETKKLLLATEAELKDATNNAGESCQLLAQIEELTLRLRESKEMHAKKEEFLKHENNELLKRLETAEARSEELSESVSMATKPLVRQLEQLHTNLSQKCNNFMKQEKALSEKNIELQTKVEQLVETNRYLKEESVNLNSKLSQLESKLVVKEDEVSRLQELYDELTIEKERLMEETVRHRRTIETLEQSHSSQIMELNREIVALENKLAVEKAATDAEKRKNYAISEQRRNIDREEPQNPHNPTNETVNLQISPKATDFIWPLFDVGGDDENTERFAMAYDCLRAGSSSTSVFENLQAQLKQKDGEIQQLQWELSRRNVERDALNTELSMLTLKIEDLNNKVSHITVLNANLQDIQTRYDALLQMCGEKMEENEELRLDLQDVKDVYKTQIDQLMKENT